MRTEHTVAFRPEVKHTYKMAVAAAMKRLGNDIVPKKVANFLKLI